MNYNEKTRLFEIFYFNIKYLSYSKDRWTFFASTTKNDIKTVKNDI